MPVRCGRHERVCRRVSTAVDYVNHRGRGGHHARDGLHDGHRHAGADARRHASRNDDPRREEDAGYHHAARTYELRRGAAADRRRCAACSGGCLRGEGDDHCLESDRCLENSVGLHGRRQSADRAHPCPDATPKSALSRRCRSSLWGPPGRMRILSLWDQP